MRKIKYIVIHCTATSQNATIESIKRYWREKLGWKNVGYHYIVDPNGNVEQIADLQQITNGVRGYNHCSIHISYIGGRYTDDRTEKQKESIKKLVSDLQILFPEAIVQGHRDFPNVNKSCPRFEVTKEFPKNH